MRRGQGPTPPSAPITPSQIPQVSVCEYVSMRVQCLRAITFPNTVVHTHAHTQALLPLPSLMTITGTPEAPYLKERARPSSLHLMWTPPVDTGGMPITTYLLQVRSAKPCGSLK